MPYDILYHILLIFFHTHQKSLYNACLVNTLWHTIANPLLWKRPKMSYLETKNVDLFTNIFIERTERAYTLGKYIQSFDGILPTIMDTGILYSILLKCPNLKYLPRRHWMTLTKFEELYHFPLLSFLKMHCPNLQRFIITSQLANDMVTKYWDINEKIYTINFHSLFQNLKEIEWNLSHSSTDNNINNQVHHCPCTLSFPDLVSYDSVKSLTLRSSIAYENNSEDRVLPFFSVPATLNKFHSLHSCQLFGIPLDYLENSSHFNTSLQHLKNLVLHHCKPSREYISALLSYTPNLETMTVENEYPISSGVLISLANYCPKIKSLRLMLDDDSHMEVSAWRNFTQRCPHLVYLDLWVEPSFLTWNIDNDYSRQFFAQLEYFRMAGPCSRIMSQIFSYLLPYWTHVSSIVVSGFSLSSSSILNIPQYCKNLKYFSALETPSISIHHFRSVVSILSDEHQVQCFNSIHDILCEDSLIPKCVPSSKVLIVGDSDEYFFDYFYSLYQ